MAARELGKQPFSKFNPDPGGMIDGFRETNAELSNMGLPPIRAQAATMSLEGYLKIVGASVAWLAIPIGLAGAGVAAGGAAAIKAVGGAALAAASTTIKLTGSQKDKDPANPAASGGTVPPLNPPASSTASPLQRLLAFAFPRGP